MLTDDSYRVVFNFDRNRKFSILLIFSKSLSHTTNRHYIMNVQTARSLIGAINSKTIDMSRMKARIHRVGLSCETVNWMNLRQL